MQALHIHWRARPLRATPLGLVLALAALLCSTWVAMDYADAQEEADALQARQARLNRLQKNTQRSAAKAAAPAQQASGSAAASTAAAVAQLQRPWDALLHNLERAQTNDVALLSLDLQGAGRSLRLVGEAKGMEPALAYVKQLNQSPALQKVVLTGQESKVQNGMALTRFALDANWAEPGTRSEQP